MQWDVKGDTTLGPFEPSPAARRGDRSASPTRARAPGCRPTPSRDARPAQWRKVIFNAATNPVGALTGLTHGRVCERPGLRALVSALVDEGKAVAAAQGIELDADPEELIDHAARPDVAYGHKASMLQDVEARRPTEIDYLNGGIARFGRELGVADAAERRDHGPRQSTGGVVESMNSELVARYANVRAAMAEHDLDALVVSGSEYTGFEGAVTYLSGFQIVHRYAYVVVPADGEPFVVFPSEARYVGEHGTAQIEQVFHDRPGEQIADRARGRGLEARRRLRARLRHGRARLPARSTELELVPFDVEFDLARAVKSDAELESVRDSVRINERGFEIFLEAYAPGKTAAEVMAAAEEWFVAEGCGRLTMNMVLTGTDAFARPEFKIARREEVLGEFLLPSLEVAGPGMHWVEVSRAIAARDAGSRATPSACSRPTSSTSRPRAARCGPVRAATTCTAPSRPGSASAAITSATSPATRSG